MSFQSWLLSYDLYKKYKFAICRRDQSKNAPSVFFEEKEDENFASKLRNAVKLMFKNILGITFIFIIF